MPYEPVPETGGSGIQSVVAGANVTVDNTDPNNPVISASVTGGGGGDALTTQPLSQFAATTSLQLKGVISDETGSGALVFATSPTLVTPTLGVASVTTVNKVAITAPATGATLTIADGKTLTVSGDANISGTHSGTSSGTNTGDVANTALTTGKLSQFAATTSSELAGVISDETGSGALVFATSPTLVTPALGVATATTINKITITPPGAGATLTIADGATLTVSANATVSGSNTGDVANTALTTGKLSQFAATTSSELAGVISDETGSGALVFATSPTLVTPTLGVASVTTVNKVTITAPASGSTLTIQDGFTLTVTGNASVSGTHTGTSSGTNTGDQTISDATISTSDITTNDASTLKHGWLPKGPNLGKFLRDDITWQTIAGGGDALTTGTLAQFAATTSAQLAGVISDETGSGALVFAISPTLVTPTLGVASATTINKITITAPATGATLTIADGKTLSVTNNATVSGTNTGDVANTALTTSSLAQFASTTSLELKTLLSDETGSGSAVFATSPTLVTPTLGVATVTTVNKVTITAPATGSTLTIQDGFTLTVNGNATVSGTNTGDVANTAVTTGKLSQFAATTSSELAGVISDETGSGALVFATSPTLVTPTLGVASATSVALGNGNVTAGKQYTYNGVVAGGNKSGAAPNLADWTSGSVQTITLTGNVTGTPTFTAPTGVSRLTLIVKQDGTGSRTMTWPSAVKWAGGAAPTLTTTATTGTDIITFLYDGTTYWGVPSLGFA